MPEKKATTKTTEKPAEMPLDPKLQEAREHMRAAHENMHKVVESMIPPAVREHRLAARKEFLLGLRSFLDAAIERVEKPEK